MEIISKIVSHFKSWGNLQKGLFLLSAATLLGFLFVLVLFLSVRLELITDLPSEEELNAISNPLSTELYARDGTLFGTFYEENRGELVAEDLTENFKNALIATEDIRFYEHNGLDFRALGRVFFKSILLRRDNSGGGSTITQQLAKNLFPRKHFTLFSLPINKFREFTIAQRLEKTFTKEEILLLYSNTVSFGERAFGLTTASRRFFGKHPSELSLAESATLVGILKAPSFYSPRRYPKRCEERRNTVLAQMVKYQFLDSNEAEEQQEIPLHVKYKSSSELTGLARYFQQHVKKEFQEWAENNPKEDGESYNIKTDGLKIYTTLDYNYQIAAELAMKSHMKDLQRLFENSWRGASVFGKGDRVLMKALQNDPYYRELKSQDKSHEEILELFKQASMQELWTWDGYKENETSSKLDSLKHLLLTLHTGVLGANPQTGDILVYVGGIDYGSFQYDNIQAKKQVGSTFKPIVYLTALQNGVKGCDYFPNELRTYSSYKDWTPENSDGQYGGYLSVEEALKRSVNTVSVQMIFNAGIENVISTAKSLGINSNLPEVPSLVLGTADISLMEMVQAYSSIANGGKSPALKSIRKIENSEGVVLYERNEKFVKPDSITQAYATLNTLLANVVNEGTAARLYNYDIPFQVMGKTGTTQNQTDGWFIGYTKEMVVGSWVGAQNRGIHFRNLGTGSGGRSALPMVASVFEFAASKGYRPSPLELALLPSCPDSIGQEEYAYLQENPNDYDHIMAKREGIDIFDILFSRRLESSERIDRRSTRKGRRRTSSRKSNNQSDFAEFRRKIEADLKKILRRNRRNN